MKRKLLGWALIIGLALASVTIGAVPARAGCISVNINGKIIDFGGQPPFIDSATGRTMIPLRLVAESLGAQVAWDPGTNSTVIQKNDIIIIMQVGSRTPVVNGATKHLEAPAVLVNGKVFVPVRFVSEAMGCNVEWDEDNNCVNITTDEHMVTPSAPPTTPDGKLPGEEGKLTSKEIVEAIVIDRVRAEKILQTHPDWEGIHSLVYLDTKNNIAYKGFARASNGWAPTIQRFHSPKVYTRETIPADVIERMKKANNTILNEFISKGIYDKYILAKNYDQQTQTSYQCAFPITIEGDISFEDLLKRAEYPTENLTFVDMY